MSSPIKFESPPVQEVAFSVSFETPKPMSAAFIGIFWSLIREELPDLSESPPIPAVVELPSPIPAVNVAPQVQMFNVPPLRRAILKSRDGRHIVQIQGDKFVLNWTRGELKTYPNFDTAYSEFDSKLQLLNTSLRSEGFGDMTYNQYELLYVNLIGPNNGLALTGEGALLVDHVRDPRPDRFLSDPSGFNWTSTYQLPDELGRFHISAQAVLVPPDNRRHVRLDLVVRGFPPKDSEVDTKRWFDLAHEWIVKGFVDATSPALQNEVWKRL